MSTCICEKCGNVKEKCPLQPKKAEIEENFGDGNYFLTVKDRFNRLENYFTRKEK